RPGTFDILSHRYDEAAGFYFRCEERNEAGKAKTPLSGAVPESPFEWMPGDLTAMQTALADAGLALGVSEVIDFAGAATIAREDAKFIFTRVVSDALRLLTNWGERLSLTRDDLSFLALEDIPPAGARDGARALEGLRRRIDAARSLYEFEEKLTLPELIAKPLDLEY